MDDKMQEQKPDKKPISVCSVIAFIVPIISMCLVVVYYRTLVIGLIVTPVFAVIGLKSKKRGKVMAVLGLIWVALWVALIISIFLLSDLGSDIYEE